MIKAMQTAKISKAKVKNYRRNFEEAELELAFEVEEGSSKVVGSILMFNNETSFQRLTMLKEFASVDRIDRLPGATISIATIDGKLVGFGSIEEDKFIDIEGAIGQFTKEAFFRP